MKNTSQKITLIENKDNFELKINDTPIHNILKYEVSSTSDQVILKLEISVTKNEFNHEFVG